MEIEQLRRLCRETCDELREINREIEAIPSNDCEQEVTVALNKAVELFLGERRELRDELRLKCEAMVDEIENKLALIGNSSYNASNCGELRVAPPYLPLLDRLKSELDVLNSKVSELSQIRNRLWAEICRLSEQMSLSSPSLPDSLAESDLDEYRSVLDTLRAKYEQRLQSANSLISKISEMSAFLGDQDIAKSCTRCDEKSILNDEFMAFLEQQCTELKSVFETRSTLVKSTEDQICAMATALEIPADLPPVAGGRGSPHRLELLKARKSELDAIKMEKIDIFIQNSRHRVEQLWDELFLDCRLRKSFDGREPCEELLKEVEHEVSILQGMTEETGRKTVIALLLKLRQVRSNEKTLDEMSHDPGRLARRGFAASLKQEERLRRYNERVKPEVLATLARLSRSWASEHDGETFYIDGVALETLLAEEAAKTPASKRRHSQGCKNASAEALGPSRIKRLKSAPSGGARGSTVALPRTAVRPNTDRNAPQSAPARTRLQQRDGAPSAPAMGIAARSTHRIATVHLNTKAQGPSNAGESIPRTRPSSISALRAPPLHGSAQSSRLVPRSASARAASAARAGSGAKPSIEVASRPLAVTSSSAGHGASRPRMGQPNNAKSARRPLASSTDVEKENQVSAPSWELDEFQKMQNLEMSYFDETQDHEVPSILRSFDYDRDAF